LSLMTQHKQVADSLFADLRQAAPGHAGAAASALADPNAGWIVCEGVEGFASLQEGVRRARAAMERGDHTAMQPVPEPVGEFIKSWIAQRYVVSQARAQTVFVLDDASRIWASRLVTYLSQQPQASGQRLHFIHQAIAGATVSLAQVRLTGGAQADSQIYWADARGRGRTSHEVRDAFSANGDVLAVLVGPMSANAFEKVSGMLRAQWELRRGSLRRVVLLVTRDSPPPRAAVDALLEDFAGAARAAYVNLSDAGQCWQALLAAAQGLPGRSTERFLAATQQPVRSMPKVALPPAQPPAQASAPAPERAPEWVEEDGPALDLLDLFAGSEGLLSVALFNHLGELIVQREGTACADSPLARGDAAGLAMQRGRQGQALRALLAAAGLQPPKHLVMESDDALDLVEPLRGMPTLWLWSNFSARHVAAVHAQVLSARLAADLGSVLTAHDNPLHLLIDRPAPADPIGDTERETA
jgi:hypothetical protein